MTEVSLLSLQSSYVECFAIIPPTAHELQTFQVITERTHGLVDPRGTLRLVVFVRLRSSLCQVHAVKEGHAWPGWTTSTHGQDSPWKSQSE